MSLSFISLTRPGCEPTISRMRDQCSTNSATASGVYVKYTVVTRSVHTVLLHGMYSKTSLNRPTMGLTVNGSFKEVVNLVRISLQWYCMGVDLEPK